MKVGITLPQAGQQATRENIIQAVMQAEEEGFDSVWVFERLLWSLKPQTPYPGTPDGSLPIEYQNIFDPIETLSLRCWKYKQNFIRNFSYRYAVSQSCNIGKKVCNT